MFHTSCRTLRIMLPAFMVAIASMLSVARAAERPPNIIFILVDDLGYGDIGCYNDQAKVPTPNIDRLAADGMRFTDAHSAATVCTTSRYALLTGRSCYRLNNHYGVFVGVGGPDLIEADRPTIASMLKSRGYATAMFGKWHIGLTFLDHDGKPVHGSGLDAISHVDFTRPIPDAPTHRGFDRFFGTACCPTTDYLYAYIDNDRVPVPPTHLIDKSRLPHNPYTGDLRRGVIAPNYKLDEVDLLFLDKDRQFIRDHVKAHPDQPFFVLHSMAAVHLASLPAPQFVGQTKAGPHGDYIHEMDWVVGQLLKQLDDLGIADNTLVMIGSDNGPEIFTVADMRQTYHHDGARPWRGMKRDDWEGGHRTPFIARWPGHIHPGSVSHQLLSLTDVFATCAAIVHADLPHNAAEDSFNMLPVLLGTQGDKPVRPYFIEQAFRVGDLSIRRGEWKYLNHRGSGGNDYNRPILRPYARPDTDPQAPGQLYNLDEDPGETTNLYSKYPDIVAQLKAALEASVKAGRSRPD